MEAGWVNRLWSRQKGIMEAGQIVLWSGWTGIMESGWFSRQQS